MNLSLLYRKITNRWKKIRLQPIRVFCLHHVTNQFDASSMNEGDWMALDDFKSKVQSMRQSGVRFISLAEAYRMLESNIFRFKKCAVLAFDDGYASLKEVLPWLEDNKIQAVLFVNGKYLDGVSYRKNPNEQYLSQDEVFALNSPYIEIGSHGWEHTDASVMSTEDFVNHINLNVQLLKKHTRYIPFHAYTWGKHTNDTDYILQSLSIIPVYIDGMKNYNENNIIHRELL